MKMETQNANQECRNPWPTSDKQQPPTPSQSQQTSTKTNLKPVTSIAIVNDMESSRPQQAQMTPPSPSPNGRAPTPHRENEEEIYQPQRPEGISSILLPTDLAPRTITLDCLAALQVSSSKTNQRNGKALFLPSSVGLARELRSAKMVGIRYYLRSCRRGVCE